jgi:hypothetical protein
VRKLLALVVVVLAVLLVAVVAVDLGSKVYLEHQLERRVDASQPGANAHFSIQGFPWLIPLLEDGRVNKVTVHEDRVSQNDFVLTNVVLTVTGVRVNRHQLLDNHQLQITAIDSGTLTAQMSQADLDQFLGVPITLGAGTASVTVAGIPVTAKVSVHNGQLEVDTGFIPITVPIPQLPSLPCLAQVTVVPGHLNGSCTFDRIPAAWLQ